LNISLCSSFSSADGTAQEAEGAPTGPNGAVVVRGSAQWAGTDGPVRLDYIADEFGYQPVGSHVHPNIARAVAQQVAEAKAETAVQPIPVPPGPLPAPVDT